MNAKVPIKDRKEKLRAIQNSYAPFSSPEKIECGAVPGVRLQVSKIPGGIGARQPHPIDQPVGFIEEADLKLFFERDVVGEEQQVFVVMRQLRLEDDPRHDRSGVLAVAKQARVGLAGRFRIRVYGECRDRLHRVNLPQPIDADRHRGAADERADRDAHRRPGAAGQAGQSAAGNSAGDASAGNGNFPLGGVPGVV